MRGSLLDGMLALSSKARDLGTQLTDDNTQLLSRPESTDESRGLTRVYRSAIEIPRHSPFDRMGSARCRYGVHPGRDLTGCNRGLRRGSPAGVSRGTNSSHRRPLNPAPTTVTPDGSTP